MTCYSLGVPQVVVNVAESPLLVVLEGKATKKVCGHLGCRADNGRKSLIVSDGFARECRARMPVAHVRFEIEMTRFQGPE